MSLVGRQDDEWRNGHRSETTKFTHNFLYILLYERSIWVLYGTRSCSISMIGVGIWTLEVSIYHSPGVESCALFSGNVWDGITCYKCLGEYVSNIEIRTVSVDGLAQSEYLQTQCHLLFCLSWGQAPKLLRGIVIWFNVLYMIHLLPVPDKFDRISCQTLHISIILVYSDVLSRMKKVKVICAHGNPGIFRKHLDNNVTAYEID